MATRPSSFALLLPALLAAAACSSDSGGPAGPSGMTVVSGGGQSAHINAALAAPLVVRVTGPGGAGFEGATVTWSVTTGGATVAPASSQSDTGGRASTVVTLGATPGPVVVTATTSGPSPVTFALTAIGPAGLAAVSGDGQTGPVGGPMADSLRVALTGTDGLPYAGATVVWAVTAGAATASPALSLTDAAGETATLITPAAAGALTVTASSGAATPATFTGSGVPPCQYVRPYAFGQSVNGTLSTLDCAAVLGGSTFYYDFYALDFAAQQSFSVRMAAGFDTWVDLYAASGAILGVNDDSLGILGAPSFFEGIFAPGAYVIGASTYDPVTTGPYTVRAAARPATITECRVIWGTRQLTVGETIETTDCEDASSGSSFYSDRMVLSLGAGATLEVRMTSGAVDPAVLLYDVTAGLIVASNNDSAPGNPTAYLSYTVAQAGLFIIDMGTAVAGQTGAYTLTLGGSGGGAGATAAAVRLDGVAASASRPGTKQAIPIRLPLRGRWHAGEGGGGP